MTGGTLVRTQGCATSGNFRIHVIYTTLEATKAALQYAATLSAGLDSEIALILTPIVPFPLPLEQPPTSLDLIRNQIKTLAASIDRDVVSYIFLCRDRLSMLESALSPDAPVVIGVRKRWGLSKAERLARSMRRPGYDVLIRSA